MHRYTKMCKGFVVKDPFYHKKGKVFAVELTHSPVFTQNFLSRLAVDFIQIVKYGADLAVDYFVIVIADILYQFMDRGILIIIVATRRSSGSAIRCFMIMNLSL